jgi:hypothetical protein
LDGEWVSGLTTNQLFSFTYVRNRVAERFPVLLPTISNRKWLAILAPLMETATRH